MRRRAMLGAVGSGVVVALGGCLGGGENGAGSGPTTLTVELEAGGVADQFDRLAVGLGKVTLTPEEGEATSFRVLETYDLADGPATVVDGESLPAGTYTDLSMTATVDRRELADGGSPQVILDDADLTTSPADGSLDLAGGTTELTATLSVSNPEDDPYRMVLSAVSQSN
jgi:hypothetical protein